MLVQAFGANASIAACKNPGARAVIDAVREVAEHFSSSVLSKVRAAVRDAYVGAEIYDQAGGLSLEMLKLAQKIYHQAGGVSLEDGSALSRVAT